MAYSSFGIDPAVRRSVLDAKVNTFIGSLFLISFAFAAGLIVWNVGYGSNPLADALAATIQMEGQ